MNDPRTDAPQEQDRHEHVAELLRAMDVRAPETLHRRVQEMVTPRQRSTGGFPTGRGLIASRLKPTLAAMAVAAVIGAAIALLTGGSTQHSTQRNVSVSAASALTLRAATMAAPSESEAHTTQLDVAVDGVAFPYWKERFGWRSTGARTDMVGGRRITTVFYSGPSNSRIGYAIVAGTPAPASSDGTVSVRGGVPYRLLQEHGASVVTWQRDGRLCVLSGRGVSDATLLRLATWGDGGPVPS